MISLKSPREIEAMEKSGAVLAGMHIGVREIIRPGISSWVIEEFAREYFKKAHAIAAQIGFEGYQYATCISVNDEICHGFPRKKLIFKDNDLVKVDTVVNLDGAYSDSCWSYAVGKASDEVKRLMDVTYKSLYLGIDQCKVGNRIGTMARPFGTIRKMRTAMRRARICRPRYWTNDARRSNGAPLWQGGTGNSAAQWNDHYRRAHDQHRYLGS